MLLAQLDEWRYIRAGCRVVVVASLNAARVVEHDATQMLQLRVPYPLEHLTGAAAAFWLSIAPRVFDVVRTFLHSLVLVESLPLAHRPPLGHGPRGLLRTALVPLATSRVSFVRHIVRGSTDAPALILPRLTIGHDQGVALASDHARKLRRLHRVHY